MLGRLKARDWTKGLALSVRLFDPDGGSGGFTGGGGGNPGTPTGSTSQGTQLPTGEHGGVFGTTYFLMIPTQDIVSSRCYMGFFDFSSFNDGVDGSYYKYRVEDMNIDRVPTVNRIIITYRDIGVVTITVTVSGVNDNNQVVSTSVLVQLGNLAPTNALMTKFVDLAFTAFRPQVTVTRAAGAGPLDITALTIRGEVEDNQ